MDMSQYRDLFLSETREHLNTMSQLLVALEQAPEQRETLDALFREAHSIKGMAASMGYERTAALAHHLEDSLDGFRAGGAVAAEQIDRLLAGLDLLEGLLDDLLADLPEREIEAFLRAGDGEAVPGEDRSGSAEVPDEDEGLPLLGVEILEEDPVKTVDSLDEELAEGSPAAQEEDPVEAGEPVAEPLVCKVIIDLDERASMPAARALLILRELARGGDILSSQPGEAELSSGVPCRQLQVWLRTALTKDQLGVKLRTMADVTHVGFADDRRRETREERVQTVRVKTDLLDRFVNLAGELITQRHMLETASRVRSWKELTEILGQTGRLIDDLHYNVLQVRLMPLESLTARLPRLVRDLSRQAGKTVSLQISGAEVGIDRVVLEQLQDPLIHLVRNAVDHGIEASGTVSISARREKDLVLVEVRDDGRGMDPAALRRKAVERGLVTASQAENLADRDALMLICQPGFSTAEQVTETSGRGVGMDVVKAAVESLGGTLDVQSAPGAGTCFQLWLPLSVAIIKILRVACAGQVVAIPLTRVLRTLDLTTDTIRRSGRRPVFPLGEEHLPLVSLASLLQLAEPPAGPTTWVVVTEMHGRRIGLQVERFLGQREAFVKRLGFPLDTVGGLSGATVEGDGRVVFIIDPHLLLEGHAVTLSPAEEDVHVVSSSE